MRSGDDLITTTREHVRWSTAIGDLAHPGPPRRRPGPLPWAAAVSGLAQAAGVKRIAASLPRSDLRSQLEAAAALRTAAEVTTTTRDRATGTACWLAPGARFPAPVVAGQPPGTGRGTRS